MQGLLAGGALIVLIYGVRAIYRLFKKEERSKVIVRSKEATKSDFRGEQEFKHLKMEEMDRYLQVLGLKRGASEEELKGTYKNILSVWDSNRFLDNPHLKEKASEKIKEIHIAYEKLKLYINRGMLATSEERTYDESQPSQQVQLPPERLSARPEAKRKSPTTTIIGGMAVVLVVGVSFIAFNRKPTKTTDYTQTASTPPSSLIGGQLTSTQPPLEAELNAKEWGIKGHSFAKSGLHRDAVNAFSKAIELEPTSEYAYALRGNSYFQLQNYQLAIKDLDKAIELNPKYGPPYYLRGLAYLNVQDYHQAIRDFNMAKELDSSLEKKEYYYLRGEAYYRLGLNDQALEDVNKIIELDPNWPEIYPLRTKLLGDIQKRK